MSQQLKKDDPKEKQKVSLNELLYGQVPVVACRKHDEKQERSRSEEKEEEACGTFSTFSESKASEQASSSSDVPNRGMQLLQHLKDEDEKNKEKEKPEEEEKEAEPKPKAKAKSTPKGKSKATTAESEKAKAKAKAKAKLEDKPREEKPAAEPVVQQITPPTPKPITPVQAFVAEGVEEETAAEGGEVSKEDARKARRAQLARENRQKKKAEEVAAARAEGRHVRGDKKCCQFCGKEQKNITSHEEGCQDMPFEVWLAVLRSRLLEEYGQDAIDSWSLQCQHCETPFKDIFSKRVHTGHCRKKRVYRQLEINQYPALREGR